MPLYTNLSLCKNKLSQLANKPQQRKLDEWHYPCCEVGCCGGGVDSCCWPACSVVVSTCSLDIFLRKLVLMKGNCTRKFDISDSCASKEKLKSTYTEFVQLSLVRQRRKMAERRRKHEFKREVLLLLYIIYRRLANSKMVHYRHHPVRSVD